MIGDGMGPAHLKAYRQFKATKNAEPSNQESLFDSYLIGSVSTDPFGSCGVITDSAASATAYSTGVKTENGYLAVDQNLKPLKTSMQLAKEQGKSTGVVATSQVVHATPAAFFSHVTSRDQMDLIADQLLDIRYLNKPYIDVVLGGGANYFLRRDRNLVEELTALGYAHVSSRQELIELDRKAAKIIGLFAEEGLPCVLDRAETDPSLTDLTQAALQRLSKNENGFFLLIEGSQIDWASHNNDIHSVMYELACFESAFASVLDFAREDDDTLVLLTADHETGGLTIGARTEGINRGHWNPGALIHLSVSPYRFAEELLALAPQDRLAYFYDGSKILLNALEVQELVTLNETYHAAFWVIEVLNRHSFTGWTTGGHTGVDVHLYGYGCGIESFYGYQKNSQLGQKIQSLIQDSSQRLKAS